MKEDAIEQFISTSRISRARDAVDIIAHQDAILMHKLVSSTTTMSVEQLPRGS